MYDLIDTLRARITSLETDLRAAEQRPQDLGAHLGADQARDTLLRLAHVFGLDVDRYLH